MTLHVVKVIFASDAYAQHNTHTTTKLINIKFLYKMTSQEKQITDNIVNSIGNLIVQANS